MVQLPLLPAMDQLRMGKCRVISFGDFRQLPPVGNSWRGEAIEPLILQDSRLFKLWSDCTMFTKQLAAAVGKETVLIPGGDDPEYQCFEGTRLIGSCTNHNFFDCADSARDFTTGRANKRAM